MTMIDCRSLIEFCKAFEQQKNTANPCSTHSRSKRNTTNTSSTTSNSNPLYYPFCDRSPFAAVDIVMLLMVLGSLGFLTGPYFKFIFEEASELVPAAFYLIGDVICDAPVAYIAGLVVAFVMVIVGWEVISHKSRKCGSPHCKGLRKAVEFDIQLESEECVKYLPSEPEDVCGVQPLELGQDHKELEAELKRMAPINGRTVLIFRAPCGCPAGRMEVWGPKKTRRIKK
ncbi:hypothetical protein Scep_013761 [Stephania cephalantha]|uniref:Ribosomal protein L34Ae n=1 Tax=Stephania cephalantha TaxID=152367 RepID=A0AAP0P116_9MAGN